MNVRDLIPWGRNTPRQVAGVYGDADRNPFLSLHREVNRAFDEVFRSFDTRVPTFGTLSAFNLGWPSIEISETDTEIRVSSEIAGLDEKDVELLIDDGMLTIRGEKRSETNGENKQFSERFYGRFERRIPVGHDIDESRVDARFKNGVLTVLLPKTETADAQVKRIEIKH